MIPIDKCKEINNKPNIIIRSGDRWTHKAQKLGLKNKGIEYEEARIPLGVYNAAMMFGGRDFWDKEDSINERKWENDPQFKKDLLNWIKTEESKVYAKALNSGLGR